MTTAAIPVVASTPLEAGENGLYWAATDKAQRPACWPTASVANACPSGRLAGTVGTDGDGRAWLTPLAGGPAREVQVGPRVPSPVCPAGRAAPVCVFRR